MHMSFLASSSTSVLVGIVLSMASISTAMADPADTRKQRAHIEQSLLDAYAQAPQIIEHIEFLPRDGSQQPLRISHHKNLADTDRILLLVLDDGSRGLVGEDDDVVVVGMPFADRIRDLTPNLDEDLDEDFPADSPVAINHRVTTPDSDGLVSFIKETLLPHLERQYGPFNQRVLFGYSFGGIFTIQALMTEPQLFDAYIAGSPSLWYHYPYYEQLAITALGYADEFQGRCLIMSAGEDEPPISNNARKYQQLLNGIDLPLITHYQRNIEIDHGHNRPISFAYGWDKVFNLDDDFPTATALTAKTTKEFTTFYKSWLAAKSCAQYSKARSVLGYVRFASKMVDAEDWQEFEAVYDYFADLDKSSAAYGELLLNMIGHFKKMPAASKARWAPRYQAFMQSGPQPYLAIHFINLDVLEYLKAQE